MTRCMKFDALDQRALQALDHEFEVDASGEVATVTGDMTVVITRPADSDQFWIRLTFPNGEKLDVKIRRAQLLEELDVEADES
jgi:hypothetical protein